MKIRLTTLLAVTALALLPSGCGAAARRDPRPAGHRAGAPRAAGRSLPQEYVDCMRAHGIRNFPNPVDGHIQLSPTIDIDAPRFRRAAMACAKDAPPGSASPGGASSGNPTPTTTRTGGHGAPRIWRGYGHWLAARARAGQFSGAVLVAGHHRTALDAGYGFADRASRVADTPRTRFCIASIGKLFTAVAIAQLVERHELAFGDPVGRYVSSLPAAIGDHVTIGQLLDMTSGLSNVVLARRHPPTTLAGMVALIDGERPQATPGSRFLYSNDGYILLGAVIQRITGQSYASYIRRHILEAAHMIDTGYGVYIPAHVRGMAHGYALVGSKLRDISELAQIANPSGGAYSTTGDLLRFARALLDHRLLGEAMTRTILVPRVSSPQPGGPPVDEYTYGFAYQRAGGVTFVGHNGGTPGYEGEIDIYPRTGAVVVVLTNQDGTMIPAIQRSEAILSRRAAS